MINVTDKALKALQRVKAEDPSLEYAAVRISVLGGGCSGMKYSLDFDTDASNPDDKTFLIGGLQFYIDAKSGLFLKGITLSYSDGLNGKGFEFSNPNATNTCGCGMSFKT